MAGGCSEELVLVAQSSPFWVEGAWMGDGVQGGEGPHTHNARMLFCLRVSLASTSDKHPGPKGQQPVPSNPCCLLPHQCSIFLLRLQPSLFPPLPTRGRNSFSREPGSQGEGWEVRLFSKPLAPAPRQALPPGLLVELE